MQQLYMERTLADCPLASVPLSPPYLLRPMRDGESGLWTTLQNRIFSPEEPQTYEAVYGKPQFEALHVLFACCGRTPVGIAAAAVRKTAAGVRYGYVDWVGVLAEHRGRRLGAALTVACLNLLAGHGLAHTGIWTQFERTTAVALYERTGYVKVPLPDGLTVGEYRQRRADAGFPPLA